MHKLVTNDNNNIVFFVHFLLEYSSIAGVNAPKKAEVSQMISVDKLMGKYVTGQMVPRISS